MITPTKWWYEGYVNGAAIDGTPVDFPHLQRHDNWFNDERVIFISFPDGLYSIDTVPKRLAEIPIWPELT